ncbi:hypothetical protein [Novosphingobium humi]|uniref:Uncharacterized protein n=1 Tax=Novosphingobium humi TaxID=2282397 RepID=A0ABY7TVV0_9SPHN|nr:hypothetical protein [Novosphingobium humi]WCT77375.1 hypothetical protein PQ457_15895 [Novosphingobium humi]WJS99103.1 hypothetical protein NYQ05_02835 [Novosphingobium humi]
MREIDPFSYFFDHASAIEGFGGNRRSPDPQYCFHTHYVEVRPGQASYQLKLSGARSSQGELTVRVHAYKPSTGGNATLVAGSRLYLGAEEPTDLSVTVKFVALRDVNYAFYGYFTDNSDISAEKVEIFLDEPEDGASIYVEPPRSIMALELAASETRPANALIHYGAPTLAIPVSQDCTFAQLSELGIVIQDVDQALAAWRKSVTFTAMQAYEVLVPGLDGLLLGPVGKDVESSMLEAGMIYEHGKSLPLPEPSSELFYDFILWPDHHDPAGTPETRFAAVTAWLGRLKIGGVAILGLRYRADESIVSSTLAMETGLLSRNEIGQWALRLIGAGYSVAPLSFVPPADRVIGSDGLASFVLIVQRA